MGDATADAISLLTTCDKCLGVTWAVLISSVVSDDVIMVSVRTSVSLSGVGPAEAISCSDTPADCRFLLTFFDSCSKW